MKPSTGILVKIGSELNSLTYTTIPKLILVFLILFVASLFLVADYKTGIIEPDTKVEHAQVEAKPAPAVEEVQVTKSNSTCENQHKPRGSESLPAGIISPASNLEMLPLWGPSTKEPNKILNLLAIPVGVKQKENVDKIVKKFSTKDFVVMLFHYDGVVNDGWSDLEWSHQAIHVSAINQTKWWFAKRFLHPDIVSEYDYIFLWDEDLGVDNFDPKRYLSIVKEEGLEISQPGIDPKSPDIHYKHTKRIKGSKVHRRTYGWDDRTKCDHSTRGAPCAGFVEIMAPVFSKAAWRCAWHLIQNDMIYGWGIDFQLGYCAQGDPTKNVGVVDSEYVVHRSFPTLGNSAAKQVKQVQNKELETFINRWREAVSKDKCLTDPSQNPPSKNQG